jgi:hypothetical protein
MLLVTCRFDKTPVITVCRKQAQVKEREFIYLLDGDG